ncbi:MAG: hypothetical protein Aurels2KO_23300 [Aureliella sp.]
MLMCFWPGLPATWIRGDLRSLVLCVGFGWATSLLLLATFVWPEWIAPLLVNSLWFAFSVFWVAETGRSLWTFKSLSQASGQCDSATFQQAQEHYIKGNWFEAEALLLRIIQQTPRDAETQLLLASVLRHTRRWEAALRRLDQLEFLQAASSWRFEIQQERSLLERAMAAETQAAETQAAADAPQDEESNRDSENPQPETDVGDASSPDSENAHDAPPPKQTGDAPVASAQDEHFVN